MIVRNRYKCLQLAFVLWLGLFAGCTHQVQDNPKPLVGGEPSFSIAGTEKIREQWWTSLDDPTLDAYINKAFQHNLTLKQAYARIDQAMAIYIKELAPLRPELTGELSRTMRWDEDGRADDIDTLKIALAWEFDLWDRLSSAEKAAALDSEATIHDMEGAALLLSAQVADTYCQMIEQKLQLSLLLSQIETNETFLDLTKLRFSHGKASLVDIHQQRQQLASRRSQLPPVRNRLSTLNNRLNVLLGMAPSGKELSTADSLPKLPGLPEPGIPADLLIKRPDLRQAHKRLIAADYRVAEAVADRLPKINIGGSAGIQGDSLSSDNRLFTLFGEIAGPIIDWGERKAEVEKQKAVVNEELAKYSQAYLVAIEEVENSLRQEKELLLLIDALEKQLEIAGETLNESRSRYMQGISDYLPVLTALNAKQRVESDIILRERELISNRILLYRALGGSYFIRSLPLSSARKEMTNEGE